MRSWCGPRFADRQRAREISRLVLASGPIADRRGAYGSIAYGLIADRRGGYGSIAYGPARTRTDACSALGAGGAVAVRRLVPATYGREQHLGDVEDLDLLAGLALGLLLGQPVGQHHVAERAGDRDLVGPGGHRLGRPVVVDPFADGLFHPHPGAARAAAERPLRIAWHLGEVRPGDDVEQLAGWRVDLVMATEVARVVVGDRPGVDRAGRRRDRSQLAVAYEGVEHLSVVHHLELDTELAVLVLQCVEAVGAARDDLCGLGLLEHLGVLLREHLEDELVAGAAGRVTGAGLALTEHREVDAGEM